MFVSGRRIKSHRSSNINSPFIQNNIFIRTLNLKMFSNVRSVTLQTFSITEKKKRNNKSITLQDHFEGVKAFNLQVTHTIKIKKRILKGIRFNGNEILYTNNYTDYRI